MAILDQFRPPLSHRRDWRSFHNAWATVLASDLNSRLPEGHFAEINARFGAQIDESESLTDEAGEWSPPPTTATIALPPLTDLVEVVVYGAGGGRVPAAVIELASPSNKAGREGRAAFASKCRSYLQVGGGLIIVDLVTEQSGNLHDSLLSQLDPGATPSGDDLYAVAYRPVMRGGEPRLDYWSKRLSLGGPLPTLPLWLQGAPCLPVDLDASYERTYRELRFPPTEG